jgi:hypothetical protein
MKTYFFTIVIAMMITATSCKSKEQKAAEDYANKIENTVKENSPANSDGKAESANIPGDMKEILGEWTLVKLLRDENGNHKIDENEENAVIESKNSIKLNADGTCKYETIMDGRYEITTEEDGRKRLIYYDMSGTQYPMKLYINSVSKDELVININNAGGSQFEIYKRP